MKSEVGLSNEFWRGARWIVAPVGTTIYRDGCPCFAFYSDAVMYCKRSQCPKSLGIRVLATVLSGLHGRNQPAATAVDLKRVRSCVAGYPLIPAAESPDWPHKLWQGQYFPMFWEEWTTPLSAIQRYSLLERQDGQRQAWKCLQAWDDFAAAIRQFSAFGRSSNHVPKDYWLVGVLYDRVLNMADPGLMQSGSVIGLYRKSLDALGNVSLFQINDPTTLIRQPTAVFVRYASARNQLTFYDGAFKRIRCAKNCDEIDLSYFDYSNCVPTKYISNVAD